MDTTDVNSRRARHQPVWCLSHAAAPPSVAMNWCSLMFLGNPLRWRDVLRADVPDRRIVPAEVCIFPHDRPLRPPLLKLFAGEMQHLMDTSSLNGNPDHEIMLEAPLRTYQDSEKEVKQLEIEVEACKTEVFRSLETLSIATGPFEFFSRLSEERANALNAIYDSRSKQQKSNTHPSMRVT